MTMAINFVWHCKECDRKGGGAVVPMSDRDAGWHDTQCDQLLDYHENDFDCECGSRSAWFALDDDEEWRN